MGLHASDAQNALGGERLWGGAGLQCRCGVGVHPSDLSMCTEGLVSARMQR